MPAIKKNSSIDTNVNTKDDKIVLKSSIAKNPLKVPIIDTNGIELQNSNNELNLSQEQQNSNRNSSNLSISSQKSIDSSLRSPSPCVGDRSTSTPKTGIVEIKNKTENIPIPPFRLLTRQKPIELKSSSLSPLPSPKTKNKLFSTLRSSSALHQSKTPPVRKKTGTNTNRIGINGNGGLFSQNLSKPKSLTDLRSSLRKKFTPTTINNGNSSSINQTVKKNTKLITKKLNRENDGATDINDNNNNNQIKSNNIALVNKSVQQTAQQKQDKDKIQIIQYNPKLIVRRSIGSPSAFKEENNQSAIQNKKSQIKRQSLDVTPPATSTSLNSKKDTYQENNSQR